MPNDTNERTLMACEVLLYLTVDTSESPRY